MAWTISDTFTDHMTKADPPAHISEDFDGMIARTAGHHPKFLSDCDAARKLIDPVMDVMHAVEGDKPYLSQILPIIMRFTALAELWSTQFPDMSVGKNIKGEESTVCDMVEKRLTALLYRPCMAAAFLLDPTNFVALPIGGCAAPFSKFDDEEVEYYMDDAQAVVARLGGDAVVEEFESFKLHVVGALSRAHSRCACCAFAFEQQVCLLRSKL